MSDLERLLRRYRWVLALAALIGAVAALAYASIVTPSYEATASLQFQDITELEGFVGTAAGTLETPAELAAASARTVNSDAVLNAARAALSSQRSINALRSAVNATVDTASNLVLVMATDRDPHFAARLANAVAAAAAAATNRGSRDIFRADATQLQGQIEAIPRDPVNQITIQNDQANLSRLQTLSIVARPAQLTQRADVPSSPTSPKPLFDTILGAILGLIIGGGVMFVRERLDRTLRSPEEIADVIQVPILAEIEESVLGTTPFILGADGQDVSRVAARFGLLRRGIELSSVDHPPRLIAVTSAGPEEGKTTVALSLACSFASLGRRTALLECDLRRPALATRLGLPATPGLVDHLTRGVPPDQILHAVPVTSTASAPNNGSSAQYVVACILAGASTNDPDEVLASSRFKQVVGELADAYEVVIIDTPPLLPVPDTLEILPLVDVRVVCVRAHRSLATELRAFRTALDRLPARPTVVATTGWTVRDMKLAARYDGYDGYYTGATTSTATPEV